MYRATIRHMLRRSARNIVAVGVVCGLVIGVGLWGLAAARRTSSTYERYLVAARSSDISVNLNSAERPLLLSDIVEIIDQASELDGVVGSSSYIGMESMIIKSDLEDPTSSSIEVVGSIDGRFFIQDRVAVTSGRLPAADRPDEVFVNDEAADDRGLEVGDRLVLAVADLEVLETASGDEPADIPVVGELAVEVVGTGTFPDDVLDDEYDRLGRILLTPAATEEWIDVAGSYVWHGLRLSDPGEGDRILTEYADLAGDGVFLNALVTADQETDVQRSLSPLVAALVVFGVASLAAALAVGSIAVGRLSRGRGELDVLRSLGVRPRQLLLISAAPGAASATVAALVGAVTCVALSPLAPVGSIRAVEPDKGVDLDVTVLLAGGLASVVVLVAASLVAGSRALRSRGDVGATARPGRVAGIGAGLSPMATLGVRRGIGSGAVGEAPVRSALIGTTLALVAVVASLTFGASFGELTDHPARYGWATDLAVTAGSGYDTIDIEEARRLAGGDDRIEGLTVAGYTDIVIEEEILPAMAIANPIGDPAVTLLSGRLPREPDELALGGRTAHRLGVDEGDEVAGPDGPLVLVGTVAFPAIGPATSRHPAMGEGALLTLTALGEDGAQPSIAFLDLADGTSASDEGWDLAAALVGSTDSGLMEPFPLLRPAELDAAEDARGAVISIAATLGVAAVAGLAVVVMSSVRARRRELAILRSLGCTARDLRRSVRWQAITLALVSVAIGAPLGVAAGRVAWQTFAESLGVEPTPTTPVLVLLGTAIGAAGLAVVASLPAAHQAARMHVAPALRPE